jgi:drug/metabolite transporter (DMT)-like permease
VKKPTADLMLVTTMCLWALNFTASKYILTHGISPLAYAAPRYAIAAAVFALLAYGREGTLRISRRDLLILAGASVVLFFNQIGFIYSLHFTTAATAALVFGTLPIFTAAIAALAGIERPSRRFLIAAAVSFAGVALVATGSNGALSANIKGDALALLGAATWAGYSVIAAPVMMRYSPLRTSAWVVGGTAILLLIAGAGQIHAESYPGSWRVWGAFAFAVFGPLVITNVLWFTAIDRVGPSRASLFANLQFFLAALFGLLLLSESITVVQVVGGVAIAAAIALSRRRGVPQPVE